ncbi:hypothetical protein TNIN_137551, partial [Trichonephila inaurata madagascariensis]
WSFLTSSSHFDATCTLGFGRGRGKAWDIKHTSIPFSEQRKVKPRQRGPEVNCWWRILKIAPVSGCVR